VNISLRRDKNLILYEDCSVNNAETLELKASRLSLCTVLAATRLLMNLLGISVVEKL
jgi:arginyl-tRNA synthetase